MKPVDLIAVTWWTALSAWTFLMFGIDKWRAGRSGSRLPELTLALLSAAGGWPGGLLAMLLFRHKTAKRTFQLKFLLALIPFATGVWLWQRWR